MSNVIGGDIGAMRGLAEDFSKTGRKFSDGFSDVKKDTATAQTNLIGEIDGLRTKAGSIDDDISRDLDNLQRKVDATKMEGPVAAAITAAMLETRRQIGIQQAEIRKFVEAAHKAVSVNMSDHLEEIGTTYATFGENSSECTRQINAAVNTQCDAFDGAFNQVRA